MRKVIHLGLFCSLFFVFSNTGNAASLYIDPAFSSLNPGDAVQLAVRLDVDEAVGECVNAIDAVIQYPANISPVDISLGDSIFSIWVEEPIINPENRTITFAGGIPNGYCGRVEGDPRLTNNLIKIVMRSPGFTIGVKDESKTADVTFLPQTTAYLNDGFGTAADLLTLPARIELTDEPGADLKDPWRVEVSLDDQPPEEFSISLERNETAFSGEYFIVFNTSDKQTGIDQYQVIEEPLSSLGNFAWGRADAPWVTTRSPYVLNDQSLNSTIRVRAIDKAGNEYVATLLPDEELRTVANEKIIMIVAAVFAFTLLILGVVFGALYFRKKRKNNLKITEDEHEN